MIGTYNTIALCCLHSLKINTKFQLGVSEGDEFFFSTQVQGHAEFYLLTPG